MVRINPSNSQYSSFPIHPSHQDKQNLIFQCGQLQNELASQDFNEKTVHTISDTIDTWQKNGLINKDIAKDMKTQLTSAWNSALNHDDEPVDKAIQQLIQDINDC